MPLVNDLLIRACRRQEIPRPPVWIMRQAGRVLPAYRALRERVSFMTLLSTPDLAVEVTLQPIEALGVDAAIMFSDILIVPQAMGMDLEFVDGVGPRFANPIRSGADIAALGPVAPEAGG